MVTYQGIFLLKLVSVFVYFLILISLSNAIANLSSGFTNDALQSNSPHMQSAKIINLKNTYQIEAS